MQTKKRIIIKGNVHDVGYRLHLLQKAEELLIPEIGAWNIYKDGKEAVRVLVGGDEEKVKEFLHFVRESFPEEANVEETPTVEDYEGDIPSIEAFSRSFSTTQLAKIAKVGVGMLKKQDQTVDILKAFREETNQNFNTLRSDYGRISRIMENMSKSLEKIANR